MSYRENKRRVEKIWNDDNFLINLKDVETFKSWPFLHKYNKLLKKALSIFCSDYRRKKSLKSNILKDNTGTHKLKYYNYYEKLL